MKWEGLEESENVDDRRRLGRKAGLAVGGGSVLIIILGLLFGVEPQKLAQLLQQNQLNQPNGDQRPADPEEERMAAFTKAIFGSTEVVWDELFRGMGKQYRRPTLVLYYDRVDSACGTADAAVGPFYCPGDSQVYIDLTFYNDMQNKLKAPGEFARAYVIAHEVGHHVQRLLGYSARVDEVRRRGNKMESNKASVRLELQADYLAGVWANHGQKRFHFLEEGDIDSALHAAFEIGDDRLQKNARGYVVPDSFTHGTSKQRQRWFRQGFRTGAVAGAATLFELPYDDL